MKRTFTLLLCLGLFVLQAGAATRLPNIIFLLADDMGWEDAHCYGHPYAKTPNIDRLATEGTRFLQCYATGVTCCPSRTGIMTSKFPATYATYPANGGFGNRVTVTELLKKQGYATGHFGKWHIGPEPKSGLYGIDEVNAATADASTRKRGDVRGRDAHIYDDAIAFIEKHKGEPFYLNVWDHVPHHPVNPPPELIQAFGPLKVDESKFSAPMREKFTNCKAMGGDVSEHMRTWLAEVRGMDVEIGRLLKRLDELGLTDNTIVVFSSDQGPAPINGPASDTKKGKVKKLDVAAGDGANERLNAMGYAGPFRGGKHNQYEGGIRIPFIVRWPGKVAAGRVDEKSVISGADWLPTLCSIAGAKINAADFDGEDASKAWLTSDFTRTKPMMWKTSAPQSEGAIRIDEWKLHHPNSRRGDLELYNIVADPGEQHNLAAEKPDVVKRLSAALEKWQDTLPKTYDKVSDGDK